MDLATIRTNVGKKLGEITATFYPAAELTTWINQAQLEFQLLQLLRYVRGLSAPGLLEKTSTWATTGGDWRLYPYVLVSDFIWPTRITYGGVSLTKVRAFDLDCYDRDWMATAGNPQHWGMLGLNLMFIYPRPAGTVNLSVTYAYVPATLSADGNVPEVGVEFHGILEEYAVYMALAKESTKAQDAAWHRQEFLSLVVGRSSGVRRESTGTIKV